MIDPSVGVMVGVADKTRSRREVTVTTGVVGLHRLTLMPGVLGTPHGAEVIARAADLQTVVWRTARRKGRRVRPALAGRTQGAP